jgi:non-ribosomal peptide synthetase component F
MARNTNIEFNTFVDQFTLKEWNQTQTNYPRNNCIHEVFEQQVAQTPNAIAAVFEEQELTYQELNQKANQLASYLRDLGVKPDGLVGIYVERSIEMLVGLWGFSKLEGLMFP